MPNVTLSMSDDTIKLVSKISKKKGISKSKVFSESLENCYGNSDCLKVLFEIPKNLVNSEEELRTWLTQRCEGLIESVVKKGI